MKKIMFNDKYGLTQAVLEGRKTRTVRTLGQFADFKLIELGRTDELIERYARYKVGEEVAVAQSMETLYRNGYVKFASRRELWLAQAKPTWRSKMFIGCGILPHRIKITGVRVERLQNITDDDCLREGIGRENERYRVENLKGVVFYTDDPILAFRFLIDRISGKGTWEKNPYVFVYDFELIK